MKSERGHRKEREGVVTKDRMNKTIVVRIERTVRHPEYRRVVRRAMTVKAHDETNQACIGDLVRIHETRPISKQKNWRLLCVLKTAAGNVPASNEASS